MAVGAVKDLAVWAIIVGAGKGTRMKSSTPKQFLSLKNRPIVGHTLKALDACDGIDAICLVTAAGEVDFCKKELLPTLDLSKPVQVLTGGRSRQDSVYRGLAAVAHTADIVVIHDGVRPFVEPAQIEACIVQARESGACMLALPVGDTLKRVNADGVVETTVSRENVWQAQTPQVFKYHLIKKAHDAAAGDGFEGTDDASLVERIGGRVAVVRGSVRNIKITYPEDLALAEALLGR